MLRSWSYRSIHHVHVKMNRRCGAQLLQSCDGAAGQGNLGTVPAHAQ